MADGNDYSTDSTRSEGKIKFSSTVTKLIPVILQRIQETRLGSTL